MLNNKLKTVKTLSLSLDFEKKLLENNLNFKIHSVYDRVINLFDPKNSIYTIVLKSIDNAPHTVRIDSEISFKKRNIDNSDQIKIINKKLFIADKLMINFKNYKVYNSKISRKIKINKKNISDNLKNSYYILKNTGKKGGAKYFYQKKYFKDSRLKEPGIIEKQFSVKAEKYILAKKKRPKKIIGLGIGSTPSGDDFLLGYFITMALVNNSYSENVFKDLQSVLKKINLSTTDLSRAMLNRALELKVRENIKNLIIGFNKNPKELSSYLKQVLTIGSSSGTDITVGIMTAYQEILLNI